MSSSHQCIWCSPVPGVCPSLGAQFVAQELSATTPPGSSTGDSPHRPSPAWMRHVNAYPRRPRTIAEDANTTHRRPWSTTRCDADSYTIQRACCRTQARFQVGDGSAGSRRALISSINASKPSGCPWILVFSIAHLNPRTDTFVPNNPLRGLHSKTGRTALSDNPPLVETLDEWRFTP